MPPVSSGLSKAATLLLLSTSAFLLIPAFFPLLFQLCRFSDPLLRQLSSLTLQTTTSILCISSCNVCQFWQISHFVSAVESDGHQCWGAKRGEILQQRAGAAGDLRKGQRRCPGSAPVSYCVCHPVLSGLDMCIAHCLVVSASHSGCPDLKQKFQMGLHYRFKQKDGNFCPLSGSGRGLLSVLYCFSYTDWRKICVPSRRAITNRTNICHVLILSMGRNLYVREWSVFIFKNCLYRNSSLSTQTYIYISLKGDKVKKKLGIITMQRDEADNDPVCASEHFYTALR